MLCVGTCKQGAEGDEGGKGRRALFTMVGSLEFIPKPTGCFSKKRILLNEFIGVTLVNKMIHVSSVKESVKKRNDLRSAAC